MMSQDTLFCEKTGGWQRRRRNRICNCQPLTDTLTFQLSTAYDTNRRTSCRKTWDLQGGAVPGII